uniref:Autotransporter outer membrane beta-barrel domain-containing protein n=2 Tax=Paracidobacterium acidisoli TaxID=2303751 RepID=A0A372IQ29_9BACT
MILANGGTFGASGKYLAEIEGNGSVTLTSGIVTSGGLVSIGPGNGDAVSGEAGSFNMTGGSSAAGITFAVSEPATISLSDISLPPNTGTFLSVSAGGVTLNASNAVLSGDIYAVQSDSLTVSLSHGSSLRGAASAGESLMLDATSTWSVTANSTITTLTDPEGISGTSVSNIAGNGFTVYYSASKSPALGGRTYALTNGGVLTPSPNP